MKRICDCGIVAVVRAENSEKAIKIADSCIKAGIAAIEITFTVPGAAEVIQELIDIYKDKILIGAGTVLDPETARFAIQAGAKYIVSPCLNKEVVKMANRYQLLAAPGAMTIKEVVECMESGADIVKVFPGELFGPKIIKSILGPIPGVKLMPTGGVSLDNVEEWIKAGSVAVGVGGKLTAGARKDDYESIVTVGKQFIENIKKARGL